jgi:hypothetical protein
VSEIRRKQLSVGEGLVLQLQLLELPLRAAFFVVRMLCIGLVMPSPE